MVNQQKGVQQDTAYSAVVVNDHMYPRPTYCKILLHSDEMIFTLVYIIVASHGNRREEILCIYESKSTWIA